MLEKNKIAQKRERRLIEKAFDRSIVHILRLCVYEQPFPQHYVML